MPGIGTTIATRPKNCLSYELIQTDSAGLENTRSRKDRIASGLVVSSSAIELM